MNVFSLFAKLSLDAKEYEKGLSEAHSKAGSFVSGVKSVVGKAGDILATVGKAAAAAVGTASTAVSALAKKSLDAYANFEQLEGGAKLMFGDAYDFIMQKSAEAYSTVQLSQNEYLQQVNGFAVGLKTALNGNEQAAAELADRIITAEADIVSATGNSQEAVQNAFNGIMKSNYTMLDNLQLGIKPTQEGMQEVIDKVNAWNAAQGKATQYTMENLADVQSALVDYVEMQGLAGYASNEASTTIQGSIAGMKAAWQNFLTGTGTPAQLVKSMKTAAGNVVKQIKVIVPQLTDGLKGLAQELVPEIPGILHDLLPTVIDGAVGLLSAVTDELPGMINTLLPPLIQGTVMIMSALVQNLPQILQSLANALPVVLTTLMQNSGGLLKAGKDMLGMIGRGIVSASKNIGPAIGTIVEKTGEFLTNTDAIMKFVKFAGEVIDNLVKGLFSQENLEKIVSNAPVILDKIGEGVVQAIQITGNALENIVDSIVTFLFGNDSEQHWTDLIFSAAKIIEWIGKGCLSILESGLSILDKVCSGIAKALGFEKAYEWGKEMLKSLARGAYDTFISPWWQNFWEGIGEWFYDLLHFGDDNSSGQRIADAYNQAHDPSMMNEYESPESVRETFRGGSYDQADAARIYAAQTGAKGVPVFGKGGIVTKPTLALIGEDGAEAVVPLEKDSDVGRRFGGSTYNVTVNMTVNASNMGDIENAGNDMIRIIDTRLRQYQLQQVRGQGGTAW